MKRLRISPGRLYRLLCDEIAARRGDRCSCPVPLAFIAENSSGCNWRIPAMTPCPKGCDRVMAQTVAALASYYDLIEFSPDRDSVFRRAIAALTEEP